MLYNYIIMQGAKSIKLITCS